MNDSFAEIYQELAHLDFLTGLEEKYLHVSARGLEWIPLPHFFPAKSFTRDWYLQAYFYMKCMRELDEKIKKLSRQGFAFGKHLMSTGNEASAVGTALALEQRDWMTAAIRDLGAFLVRGMSLEEIIAQSCGRATSPTGGWDAGLHMTDHKRRAIGIISHLGTMSCIATGLAFAARYLKKNEVTLAFSGEGATSTGDVHEALNIASVQQLPFVLVIENNQWAFGTPRALQYAVPTLALRSLGYGEKTEGYLVDGTNVLAVYHVVKEALHRARNDRIMSIIETVSMRYEGHSLADPFEKYVPKEQLETWKKKDPLKQFKNFLMHSGLFEESDVIRINEKIFRDIDEAAEKVKTSPHPDGNNIESAIFTPSLPSSVPVLVLTNPPREGKHITYHTAIREAMMEEMDRDERVFIIGEDIGVSGGAFKITEGFSERYDTTTRWDDCWKNPNSYVQRRVIDAPIAEAGFCGLAIGASIGGLCPIVEFQYADFASEAFKMIVNCAATQAVKGLRPFPIVFRLPSGWTPNVSLYHGVNPESWFAGTPGLKIVAPITAFDAKGLFKAALRDGNPVLFLEYKGYYRLNPEKLPPELNCSIPEEDYVVPIGKARVMKQGTDLTVISYGSQIFRAVEAIHRVEQERKVSIELIDLRSIVPYDRECILDSVKKTSRALVTCEAPKTGCFGATVASFIQENGFSHLDAPVRLIAAADTPVPFAKELEEAHLPTTEKVAKAMRELLDY